MENETVLKMPFEVHKQVRSLIILTKESKMIIDNNDNNNKNYDNNNYNKI